MSPKGYVALDVRTPESPSYSPVLTTLLTDGLNNSTDGCCVLIATQGRIACKARAVYCYRRSGEVCLCVCLSAGHDRGHVALQKGLDRSRRRLRQTRVDPGKHALGYTGSAHWRHLAHTVERMTKCDLIRITLTTCHEWYEYSSSNPRNI